MNLTYKQIGQASNALSKLVNTTVLEDYKEAIALGKLKAPLEEALELLNKGKNAIEFKYAKMAMVRESDELPTGYSTPEETEAQNKETEIFRDEICTVSFKFPTIKEATVEAMFKDKDKKMKLTGYDLAIFEELELIGKKSKTKKVEK